MKRHLITIGCLIIAFTLYFVGLENSAIALVMLGGVFEMAFWVRAFRVFRKRKT